MAGIRRIPWSCWALLSSLAGCTAQSCRPHDLTSDGAWDVQTPRTVVYAVHVVRSSGGAVQETNDHKVQLAFSGAGQVDVSLDGAAAERYVMTADGILSGKTPLPSSVELLAMVPGKKAQTTPNGSQVFDFPDAAARDAEKDTVIYGSEVTATIEHSSPTVAVKLAGTAALVQNAGLASFEDKYLSGHPTPEVQQLLDNATATTPYLTGALEFDPVKSEVVSASADIIEMPFVNGAVGTSSTVALSITRQ